MHWGTQRTWFYGFWAQPWDLGVLEFKIWPLFVVFRTLHTQVPTVPSITLLLLGGLYHYKGVHATPRGLCHFQGVNAPSRGFLPLPGGPWCFWGFHPLPRGPCCFQGVPVCRFLPLPGGPRSFQGVPAASRGYLPLSGGPYHFQESLLTIWIAHTILQ